MEVLSGVSLSKNGTIYFGSSGKNGYFGYDFATGAQKFVYQKDLGGTALKGNSYTVGADGTIYTVAELTTGGAIVALNPDGTENSVSYNQLLYCNRCRRNNLCQWRKNGCR